MCEFIISRFCYFALYVSAPARACLSVNTGSQMTHPSQGPTTRLLLITGGCIYPSLRYGVGSNPSLDRHCWCAFLHSHKVITKKNTNTTLYFI